MWLLLTFTPHLRLSTAIRELHERDTVNEALVASVDAAMFPNHDELASYCSIAPADSQSGTSVLPRHIER